MSKKQKYIYEWGYNFEIHSGLEEGSFLFTPVVAVQVNEDNKGVMIGWLFGLLEFRYTRTKKYK